MDNGGLKLHAWQILGRIIYKVIQTWTDFYGLLFGYLSTPRDGAREGFTSAPFENS